MKTTVNLEFLQEREETIKKQITVQKAREASATVNLLETELQIVQLAIKGLGR